jgi:hypothetical protein
LPLFPPSALVSAREGLHHLTVSSYLFAAAAVVALLAVGVRLATAAPPPAAPPRWVPAALVTLAFNWVFLGLLGCWLRSRGYALVRPAAAAVDTEGWAKAAAAGTKLSACGVVSLGVMLTVGMAVRLPAELAAATLIGLVCGLIGLALEFAFLTVIHRLLWEADGWQAANRTGRYTLSFVFAAVAAMGSVILGGTTAVLAFGGMQRAAAGPMPMPVEVRWIFAAVLVALAGCVGWVVVRYVQLLTATRNALGHPEPYPPAMSQRW